MKFKETWQLKKNRLYLCKFYAYYKGNLSGNYKYEKKLN